MQIRTSAFDKSIKTIEHVNKTYSSATFFTLPPDFAKRLAGETMLRTKFRKTAQKVQIVD